MSLFQSIFVPGVDNLQFFYSSVLFSLVFLFDAGTRIGQILAVFWNFDHSLGSTRKIEFNITLIMWITLAMTFNLQFHRKLHPVIFKFIRKIFEAYILIEFIRYWCAMVLSILYVLSKFPYLSKLNDIFVLIPPTLFNVNDLTLNSITSSLFKLVFKTLGLIYLVAGPLGNIDFY